MATDFTQDSVLYFIKSNGGKVKNSELLFHYKAFVRDHENKKHYRELFKKFVNSVAVVKQEEGVSYVVLRKKFGGQARDVAGFHATETPGRKPEQAAREKERSPVTRNQEAARRHLTESHLPVEAPKEVHVLHRDTKQNTKILPSAGILNNNNEENMVSFEKPIQSSSPNAPERAMPQVLNAQEPFFPHTTKPVCSKGSSESFEADCPKGPVTLPELNSKGIYTGAKFGQPKETDSQRNPFCPLPDVIQVLGDGEDSVDVLHFEQVEQHAVSGQRLIYGDDDDGRSDLTATSWPLQTTLEHAGGISTSSPCLSDSHQATPPHTSDSEPAHSNSSIGTLWPQQGVPAIHIQHLDESITAAPTTSQHPHHIPAGYTDPPHHQAGTGLSSSHDCLLSSADSPEWPQSSPEQWTSEEELGHRGLYGEQGFKVREMLRRAQETKMLSLMYRAERKTTPWHHSTGHLPDEQESSVSSSWHHSVGHLNDQESKSSWHCSADHLHDDQESSGGSHPGSPAPQPRMRPPVERINSKLRGRLCRSLGADLDQPFLEDGVSARHNRLQLISSTLSFRYPSSTGSTPSHSHRDLTMSTASSGKSLSSLPGHDTTYFHKQDLEPTEHDWLVRGASGNWAEIYALFREEPSLLNKRDFITGYTVLHWIAKHGDHKVLNTLWYGVRKKGQKLDVDAKTTCGYTPLHLAAIHGHKKMIRLLVHKFNANVTLRDTSGKKPWQYLGRNGSKDMLALLGAPQRTGGASGGKTALALAPHSSAERLGATSAKVKRSTSIAAFLKHKALLRFPGHHSDSLL